MRTLAASLALTAVLIFGGLYAAYGQVDPCRIYAVERARRAESAIGLHLGSAVERWTRLETSQLTSGECAGGLVKSWSERLQDDWH